MTQKEALGKMAKFCAYQERCQSEIKHKLFGTGLSNDEINNVICDLIEHKFLDEERFAKAFVRGKFNQKGWGRIKIQQHLNQKQISSFCQKKGMLEINENDYLSKLEEIILKKSNSLKTEDQFIRKIKTASYAISRGFESELVWEVLD
ncbi:RecX family transcriptional regulator [Flavobacteriales bacterium]|nr:RecX family transcriptional regulator [Flavobacteriales bacterium]